ncbi:unnamed protein product [Closterium sp. NIES-53]
MDRYAQCRAIAKGFNKQFHLRMRSFFYMPFMHSEDLPDQDLCVQLLSESVAEASECSRLGHSVTCVFPYTLPPHQT